MILKHLLASVLVLGACARLGAADAIEAGQNADQSAHGNKPERLAWLQDAGFGMFIHWSFDGQLGGDISHVAVGASREWLDWYFHELPQSFNPKRFDADELLGLAKLAGMRYVVLTAKHHSGFCMWDSATTDFTIMHTPYARDLVADYTAAARRLGLGVGIYYSPEDFSFLDRHGLTVTRPAPPMDAATTAALAKLVGDQTRELMTKYGKVEVLFIDGEPKEPCRDAGWSVNPDLLVTRGAITTPEQHLPGRALEGAWESCVTMGTQWPWKPTDETYKSGTRLIDLLIETRAKGGSLLLNVGPKADGELPIEQEGRLREIALWHAANGEAIHRTRPWIVTNEEGTWFTKQADSDTVYAFLTGAGEWAMGQRREFVLHSVAATARTEASVLGQTSATLEYQPGADTACRFTQTAAGLSVSAVRTQRFHTDAKWPNPFVLKLTHVRPALKPPAVDTQKAEAGGPGGVIAHGTLLDLGDAATVQVGFEYQEYLGFTEALNNEQWTATPLTGQDHAGAFTLPITGLQAGKTYQVRAVVAHPKLTMRGDFQRITVK